MNTVIHNVNTIIVKNSKFICLLYPVSNIEDIWEYLNDVQNTYKDATHYCYAYIINEMKKESDDGEPGGTAGIPMLQVLEKNNLNHVLCIVVRYFGGIKLGAGGLVRAYTKSVVECLNGHTKKLIKGYCITIHFDYKFIKQVDYILKDSQIIEKDFQDSIIYKINTTKDIIDKLAGIPDVEIQVHCETYF